MLEPFVQNCLTTTGWTIVNEVPEDADKFVVIGAPHTSNWDFVLTLGVAATIDIDFSWVGKKELFQWPYGGLMESLGGVSVDRSKSHGYVEQLTRKLKAADQMALCIAPEGTRSGGERWKSGFYYIAKGADVPIVLGYVDYARQEAGLGPMIYPVDSRDDVMEQVREFYADKTGHRHENFIPPTLG